MLYVASQGQLEIRAKKTKEKEFNKKPRWLQLGLPSRKWMYQNLALSQIVTK